MRKTLLIVLLISTICSCNLSEQFKKIKQLNSELKKEFNHQNINGSYHFGTEDDDDYFQIDFYRYPISDKTNSELEIIASKVKDYIKSNYPEYDDLDYIEVRFTKESSDNAESFTNFKFR